MWITLTDDNGKECLFNMALVRKVAPHTDKTRALLRYSGAEYDVVKQSVSEVSLRVQGAESARERRAEGARIRERDNDGWRRPGDPR